MVGRVVDRVLADRYRLLRRIGGGGMGAVFEAEDLVLQRRIAVKLLTGVGTQDLGFLREARALSRLRHSGIVGLYDAGADEGDAYLVLELVRGRTLREALAEGPLAPEEAGRVGRELAEALAHAHRLGVVHRDLSPGNVLIDGSGRVRLADFGIARLSETTATAAGEVWGTPAYMAPEQVAGDPVGPPADVYALGLVMLEALTGERAFPGAPTEAGFARLHRDPAVPADLPGGWAPLLAAMTAREPANRPAAATVAARLGTRPEVLRTLAPSAPAPTPVAAAAPGTVPLGHPVTRPLTTASAPVAAALTPTSWWRRPAAAVTGLLLTAAVLVGLAARSESPSLPEAVATTSPVAQQATTEPPPPPPADDDDEDDDDDEEDRDEGGGGNGKGRGKGKKD